MIENFIEYMWYLLTTPLKKLKRSLNKWYIFCRVFGRRFDEAKEAILRARDEGMAATCSHEMLPVHGADRRLTRYEGEHPENFRIRIARYEEVCRLGGTNEGILLAVRSLGFEGAKLVTVPDLTGDTSRWAEFCLILAVGAKDNYPIDLKILKKEVRKVKEVGAKDNYLIAVLMEFEQCGTASMERLRLFFQFRWYGCLLWSGDISWDGENQWDSIGNSHPVRITLKLEQKSEFSHSAELVEKYHYRTWDGGSIWNGGRKWDAEIIREVL